MSNLGYIIIVTEFNYATERMYTISRTLEGNKIKYCSMRKEKKMMCLNTVRTMFTDIMCQCQSFNFIASTKLKVK